MSYKPLSRPFALIALCGCALLVAARADGRSWTADPGRQILSIGHDSVLAPGEHAARVVAIFGSSIAGGEVSGSVVAVFGNARVTGTVGRNAVAVLGDAYVDGTVNGNVIAVLGNVRLGPQATVSGRIIDVLGTVDRGAGTAHAGGIERILPLELRVFASLPQWARQCLLYGRLLALSPRMAWAWALALTALGFYLLLAALFADPVARCVRTLETHPGRSILAALVAILVSPAIYLLLLVTIVGIALIPLVWAGLLCAALFGRAVALAWLGERCLPLSRAPGRARIVLDVLVGGSILIVLYLVPLIGIAAFSLFGLIGLGAVLYTLILAASATHTATASAAPPFAAAAATPSATAGAGPAEPAGTGSPSGATPGGAAIDGNALPRAGFWIRIGALAIDAILVSIVLGILSDALRLELIALAAYGAVMWKLRGSTLGGIICDLKVVRLDGRPVDWGTAVIRALGCFLSLAVAGLGFVWIALDPEHQAWHDKIAGTGVVRVPRGVPLL